MEKSGWFIYVVVAVYFYHKLRPMLKGMYSYLIKISNNNLERRKHNLVENLKYVEGTDLLLTRVLNHEIKSVIYIQIIGYNWNRERQLLFLDFYDKVKNELSLKEFKFLFENCKINEEKLVSIKIRPSTMVYLYSQYFLMGSAFIVTILFLILSFMITDYPIAKQLIVAILLIISYAGGIYFLGEVFAIKNRLKKIKKFDNYAVDKR